MARINDTEAAANLTFTGGKRGVDRDLDPRIGRSPLRHQVLDDRMITFTDDELEILDLGEKGFHRFRAQLLHDFLRRGVAGEHAFSDFDRQFGQSDPHLLGDHFLSLAEAGKDTILNSIHFGAEFNKPAFHAVVILTGTFTAAALEFGRKVCFRKATNGLNRLRGQHEGSRKRDGVTGNGHD
jgi:hypothetical protein